MRHRRRLRAIGAVAQSVRAGDSESSGRRFEPCPPHRYHRRSGELDAPIGTNDGLIRIRTESAPASGREGFQGRPESVEWFPEQVSVSVEGERR